MLKVSPKAKGITKEIKGRIQDMHNRGIHPGEITNKLKAEDPVFSGLDEGTVRKYIDYTGESKTFEMSNAGLGVKVTPTKKLLEMMEQHRHLGMNGVRDYYGIPREMAQKFIRGELNAETVEKATMPLAISKRLGYVDKVISNIKEKNSSDPKMQEMLTKFEQERKELEAKAAQARKNGN